MQVLKPAEKSLRIRYDHLTNNKYIEVWQGRNRTIEQEENPFAIFSDDYENVESPSYSYNNRDFKNFAASFLRQRPWRFSCTRDAGLQPGDRIAGLDGRTITDFASIREALAEVKVQMTLGYR